MVSCRGVVQLGGPDPGFAQWDTLKVGACKSIIFNESSREVKIYR